MNQTEKPIENILKKVSIQKHETFQILDKNCVILGEVKEVQSIKNLYVVYKEEGIKGVEIDYVGGMCIWLEFCSSVSYLKSQ